MEPSWTIDPSDTSGLCFFLCNLRAPPLAFGPLAAMELCNCGFAFGRTAFVFFGKTSLTGSSAFFSEAFPGVCADCDFLRAMGLPSDLSSSSDDSDWEESDLLSCCPFIAECFDMNLSPLAFGNFSLGIRITRGFFLLLRPIGITFPLEEATCCVLRIFQSNPICFNFSKRYVSVSVKALSMTFLVKVLRWLLSQVSNFLLSSDFSWK
mmetsp:Transcript_25795/g.53772  ORF Transcript_25795/g.53772 Transcript_25795/m.53772 type:complete len:208 (+) Transcript_25795:7003-7626(+)